MSKTSIFDGLGVALRREGEPEMPGEPFISMGAANAVVAPFTALLKATQAFLREADEGYVSREVDAALRAAIADALARLALNPTQTGEG